MSAGAADPFDVVPDAPGAEADELTDAPEPAGSPVALRDVWLGAVSATAVAAALVVAVVLPDRAGAILPRVVAVAALPVLVVHVVRAVRASPVRYGEAAILTASGLVAAGLVANPEGWLDGLARSSGALLVASAVEATFGRGRSSGTLSSTRTSGVMSSTLVRVGMTLLGLGLLLRPTTLALPALWVLGVGLLLWAVLLMGGRLGLIALDRSRGAGVFGAWLEAKGEAPQDRPALYTTLFFEGTDRTGRLVRFSLMMLFASVVSALGVLTDSTAVVVGAMLIAPLINPMMGMALSLAMGWPTRLTRSALAVLGGVVISVATGWALSALLDLGVDLETNTQILVRTSPTIADLIIAAAAGGAGAYALSRPDLSSSLPGVAVAIALVPPLSVVGVSAQAGNWSQVAGTTLLFLTNLVAILVVGGVVFVVTGVAPLRRVGENQQRVRTSLMAVIALAALVVGGLVANGRVITADALNASATRRAVIEWLGDDTEFTIASVDLEDDAVTVVLIGPGEPPAPESLGTALVDAIGGPVHLDLQWVPRERRVLNAG